MAHHRVALLTDGTQPLPAAATFFAGIQTRVTHHLLASLETADQPNRQHKRQSRHGPASAAGSSLQFSLQFALRKKKGFRFWSRKPLLFMTVIGCGGSI